MQDDFIKNCVQGNLREPYNQYAEIIGMENLYLLTKELGGTSIYIPKTQYLLKEAVENALKDEFDGSNYKKLAHKYNLCEKTVRNRLKEKNKERSNKDGKL